MIVRYLDAIIDTQKEISGPGWNSRRMLLASDNIGYSITDTLIEQDVSLTLEFKKHIVSCYCIEGIGKVCDLSLGSIFELLPGSLYSLNFHDRHILTAITKLRLVCVFCVPR